MTLAQFAIALGADPKWVQNAGAALGRQLRYTPEEARRLGLARMIQGATGMPLQRADEVAAFVLASHEQVRQVVVESADGSVQLTIDLARYESTFGARLALARREQPERRGRPPRRGGDPLARASEFGIDISLLRSNLQRTPEERLRNAGENAELVRRLREARR